MTWEVETEPEVTDWYLGLSGDNRDVAAERIDLLANFGHMLRMPHSRQLGEGRSNCGSICPTGRGGSPTGTGQTG
jgi:hypothetical protein